MWNSRHPLGSNGKITLLLSEGFCVFKELISAILPDKTEQLLMLVGGLLGTVLSFLFGDTLKDVVYLFLLVLIDYCMGNVVAYRTRNWNSHTGFLGITKKLTIFVVVAFCHWADVASGQETISFRAIAVCAYAVNELGSILENLELLGFGGLIPPILRKAMRVAVSRSLPPEMMDEVFDGKKEDTGLGSYKGKDSGKKV